MITFLTSIIPLLYSVLFIFLVSWCFFVSKKLVQQNNEIIELLKELNRKNHDHRSGYRDDE